MVYLLFQPMYLHARRYRILGADPQVSGSGTPGAAGGLNLISRSMVRDDQSYVGEMHNMHSLHLDAHGGTRPGSCGEAC